MSITLHQRRWLITGMLLFSWTFIIVSIATFNIRSVRTQTDTMLLDQYRLLTNIIMTTWRWNAGQGGVYVKANESITPNMFLDEADRMVVTADGDTLTMISHIRMGYGFETVAPPVYSTKVHPASLAPINPANLADAWESDAIRQFEAGEPEIFNRDEYSSDSGQVHYAAPIIADVSCLRCHAGKGFRAGSIAGGLAITADVTPVFNRYRREARHMASSAIVTWIIGCAGILVIMNSISKQIQKEMTLQKFEGVLEMAGSAAHELNQPLQIISGYAELISILDTDDRQTTLDMMKAIRENVLRLSAITRKLNGITRYETIELTTKDRIIDLDKAASATGPIPRDTPSGTA